MQKILFFLLFALIINSVPLNAATKKFYASFEVGFGNFLNYIKNDTQFYINPGLSYDLDKNWNIYAGWYIPFVSNMNQLENHLFFFEAAYSFSIPSTNLTLTLGNDNFFQFTPVVLGGGYLFGKLSYNKFFSRFKFVYWNGNAIKLSALILGQGYTFAMGDFSLDAVVDLGISFEQMYEKYYIQPVLVLNYNF